MTRPAADSPGSRSGGPRRPGRGRAAAGVLTGTVAGPVRGEEDADGLARELVAVGVRRQEQRPVLGDGEREVREVRRGARWVVDRKQAPAGVRRQGSRDDLHAAGGRLLEVGAREVREPLGLRDDEAPQREYVRLQHAAEIPAGEIGEHAAQRGGGVDLVGFEHRGQPGGTWAPRLLAGYGVALAGAGLFTADPADGFPPGTPPGRQVDVSWHGTLHLLFGSVGFTCLIAACFVVARHLTRGGQRRVAITSRAVGVVFALAFAGIATGAGGVAVNLGFIAAVVVGSAWLTAVAVALYRRTRVADARAAAA